MVYQGSCEPSKKVKWPQANEYSLNFSHRQVMTLVTFDAVQLFMVAAGGKSHRVLRKYSIA